MLKNTIQFFTSKDDLDYKYKVRSLENCPDKNSDLFCAMVIDLLFSKDETEKNLGQTLLSKRYVIESINKSIGVLDAYIYYSAYGKNFNRFVYEQAIEYLYDIVIRDKDKTQEILSMKLLEFLSLSTHIEFLFQIIKICSEIDSEITNVEPFLFCILSIAKRHNNPLYKPQIIDALQSLQKKENCIQWDSENREGLKKIIDIVDTEEIRFKRVDKKQMRIAIALSGGGIRAALFHSGAMKAIEEKFREHKDLYKITRIYGVSGGALFGSFYCLNNDPNDFYIKIRELSKISLIKKLSLFKMYIPNTSPKNLENFIETYLYSGIKEFKNLIDEPSLAILTYDRVKGEGLVFSKYAMKEHLNYSLTKIITASCAIPPNVKPVKIEEIVLGNYANEFKDLTEDNEQIIVNGEPKILHDGGLVENSGLSCLQKESECFDAVIICDCGKPKYDEGNIKAWRIDKTIKRIIEVSINTATDDAIKKCKDVFKENHILIDASSGFRNLPTFSVPKVEIVDELYKHGEEKARHALDGLSKLSTNK
jgi:NTE family protein